jgi:hypothetical protein
MHRRNKRCLAVGCRLAAAAFFLLFVELLRAAVSHQNRFFFWQTGQ